MAIIIKLESLEKGTLCGITIWPFIFIRKSMANDERLINHEKIHIRQQFELLLIPFYILYLVNYISNGFKYKTDYKAYREIIFECEAFENDHDLEYLKKRKPYAFLKYWKKK